MHRRQGFITLLVFLISISLFYFFVWNSFIETRETYKKWKDVHKEKESIVELTNSTPQMSIQFQEFTESALPLLQATPQSFKESDYISLLSSLSTESGNVLTTIKVSQPGASGDIPINIGFAGTLTTLEKLLQKIERTLPLLEVTHFTSKGGDELQDFSLQIKSYMSMMPVPLINDSSSIQDRLAALKRGLAPNLDTLKDDAFKTLKVGEGFPSPAPFKEDVGRPDPFAPLE